MLASAQSSMGRPSHAAFNQCSVGSNPPTHFITFMRWAQAFLGIMSGMQQTRRGHGLPGSNSRVSPKQTAACDFKTTHPAFVVVPDGRGPEAPTKTPGEGKGDAAPGTVHWGVPAYRISKVRLSTLGEYGSARWLTPCITSSSVRCVVLNSCE